MTRFDVIAFDADDTLWHEIEHYHDAEAQFVAMLSRYHDKAYIQARMVETDIRNLKIYGYGVKGFVLSMIETAIELTEGRVTGNEIETIMQFGREMMNAPIALIDGVRETLEQLRQTHPIMIITKGDLFAQETKIARSGLADLFTHIEIISDKKAADYRAVLQRYSYVPDRFLMAGNSLRSDVMPVCEVGGHAIWLPRDNTWVHEQVPDVDKSHFVALATIRDIPAWVQRTEQGY